MAQKISEASLKERGFREDSELKGVFDKPGIPFEFVVNKKGSITVLINLEYKIRDISHWTESDLDMFIKLFEKL